MYYFEILTAFYRNRIDYLIVGGLAVNLHGAPRVTQDMDIVIALNKENILNINKVLKELGFVPRLPVNPDDLADESVRKEWIADKNMKAFSYYHSKHNYQVIDIVLYYNREYEQLKKNRVIKNAAGIDLNLISIDDLIEMKHFSGRQQDLSDIAILEKIKSYKDQ